MCGKSGNNLPGNLPVPLQLYGKDLPWVVSAVHLGHHLHQSCTMDQDVKIKRAQFIDNSLEIRDIFHFALPSQVLQAVQLYSLHCYGSMLWDLGGVKTHQFYRAWNTCVKLVHGVPRSTHTYMVEHLLACEFIPVKTELFARYIKFIKSIKKSVCFEMRYLFSIVKNDIQSTTGGNLYTIQAENAVNPFVISPRVIRENPVLSEIPVQDQWRLAVLKKWLTQRQEMETNLVDTKPIQLLIDALCSG